MPGTCRSNPRVAGVHSFRCMLQRIRSSDVVLTETTPWTTSYIGWRAKSPVPFTQTSSKHGNGAWWIAIVTRYYRWTVKDYEIRPCSMLVAGHPGNWKSCQVQM